VADRDRPAVHWSDSKSLDMANAIQTLKAKHVVIRPHCPWQNGKVERHNRTPQTKWAYRQVFTTDTARTQALAAWLHFYNTGRRHSSLEGQPPTSRLS